MIDDSLIAAHRAHALSPEHPVVRGTAQNPDVYFQARETANPFYTACPDIVQKAMDKFGALVGRHYHIFDYAGASDAETVIIVMGSGAETAEQTAKYLNARGEKVGVITVHLFRPFSGSHLLKALPATIKKIAVLDRTKEPGSLGEPLYQDVVTAISEGMASGTTPFKSMPLIVGGRFGLASKEFTPGMVKGVFNELAKEHPKNHFTIGIKDDVSHTSLDFDPDFEILDSKTVQCLFYGLGADGTVGANHNSIRIIGGETDNYGQGYFYYDSRKSGTITTSHLRFGPKPIQAPYLITKASFIACHQFSFLERVNVTEFAVPGGVFLLNSMYGPDEVWDHLPQELQADLIQKKLRFYTIDAYDVAQKTGMGARINTVMQTCFFAISGILPRDQAIEEIKKSIRSTYGKRGEAVVNQNFEAVDQTLANLHEVKIPAKVTSILTRRQAVPDEAPDFVRQTLGPIISSHGDTLPVSAHTG